MSLSRRTLFGTAALAGLGLAAAPGEAAESAPPAAPSPSRPDSGALRGTVSNGNLTLPPLHADTEMEGPPPNPDPVAKRLGVAVVGLGHLSVEQILPAFGQAKHVRLAALVSGEPAKARALAAQYGVPEKGLYDYAGFDRVQNDPDIDIVYIVLPNSMHAEYTVRAAAAGKHVLCEKPMATSVPDAQRMIDACRAAGRKLMIAYRCQYVPQHREIIRMARSAEFGRVRLIEAVNGQNDRADGQWRQVRAMAGGGSLPDVGIYCLNAARYVTGEEPTEITAQITRPKDDPRFREVEDIAAFTLRFPSGVIANCASGYSFHERRGLWVQAERAWFGLDPAFSYDNIVLEIGRRQGQANAVERRTFAPHNQFALEMDHFAQAIRAGTTPRTPGEEGLQDMKLIEAIYQAAAGGSTVKLPAAAGLDATRGGEGKGDK